MRGVRGECQQPEQIRGQAGAKDRLAKQLATRAMMRRVLKFLSVASVVAVVASAAPASATVLITSDNGGRIRDYMSRFASIRHSGQHVVIDGACRSACTMVLGLVPRNRVCATRNASFGFHAAWQPDGAGGHVTNDAATRRLLTVYPARIRDWIAHHGGLNTEMITLTGPELAALVPSCTDDLGPSEARSRAARSFRAQSRPGGIQASQAR